MVVVVVEEVEVVTVAVTVTAMAVAAEVECFGGGCYWEMLLLLLNIISATIRHSNRRLYIL